MANRNSEKHGSESSAHFADDGRSKKRRGGRSGSDAARRAGVSQHAASRSEGVEIYSARRKRGHGKIVRNVLIVVLAVAAAAGTAIALYVNNISNMLSSDVSSDLLASLVTVQDSSDPFYVLLLGVDKSDERTGEWGTDPSNYRADTIILMRVDPSSQKITAVSIPRDTMIDLGDYGTQKINAAYSLGGASYMVEVVSEFAGVDISHYAEIDFEAFIELVDTIGGIEVTLPIDVVDEEYAGINLSAGTYTLDGTTALALVRTRHAYDAYGAGDYYRAANQRMVIAAILDKLFEQDIATIATIISEMADNVTTDFSVTDLIGLASKFMTMDTSEDFYSGQCPTESQYIDSLWYEIVDEDAWAEMMARVDAGESPYEDESDDETVGVSAVAGDGTSTSSEEETTEAVFEGDVLVLNGTTTTGLAMTWANELIDVGFTATADNASSSDYQSSIIIYNSGGYAAALGVAQTMGLDSSVIQSNDGDYSADYDVVVVIGADF